MTIVLLAAHVLMSVPLVQFLRARSILSIPTSAQSAVLALMHVLLEQSLSKKDWRLPDGRNKIPCRKKQGIFVFLYVRGKVGTHGCLPYLYIYTVLLQQSQGILDALECLDDVLVAGGV